MGVSQLVTRTAALVTTVLLLAFLVALRQRLLLPTTLIDQLIQASTQTGSAVSSNANTSSWMYDSIIADHLRLYNLRCDPMSLASVAYLQPLLQCRRSSSPKTGHIRLPSSHLNISLNPLNIKIDTESRHFNPTIIPLPSYSASFTPARYLLITRLVTPGLHQESLACLATFCLPQVNKSSTHLPPDTVLCTSGDAVALGPSGGMRCVTKPRRLDIPPTPAKQCRGDWASFPDIPGFHDPRAMWSGTGEPLIVVNSASTYGCIGLWVMDLRVLLPELRAVLERRAPTLAVDEDPGNALRRAYTRSERQSISGRYLQPVLRYQTLTELTRWEGRGEVEKNWILWFPGQEGETWVSYESFGHWKPGKADIQDDQGRWGEPAETNGSRGDGAGQYEQQHFLPPLPPWSVLNVSNITQDMNFDNMVSDETPWSPSFGGPAAKTASSSQRISTSINTSPHSQQNATASNHQPIRRSDRPTRRPPPTLPTSPQPWTFQGGRSISKLTSHGRTTPNLTSPHEPPCLPPSFFTDPLGKPGHFHQSTPALKLILCDRSAFSSTTPLLLQHHTNRTLDNSSNSCANPSGTPTRRTWAHDGRAVHFALVHRKFSDGTLGMPLRYERWALVWESRYPFRLLAVSRHPVAFAGEVVRPWTRAENGLDHHEDDDDDKTAAAVGRAGFTYTTSVAWAWRPASAAVMAGEEEEDAEEDAEQLARLGVGFLGDEVVVGVGLDDVGQVVVRVKVEELLSCLRLCPGVGGAN